MPEKPPFCWLLLIGWPSLILPIVLFIMAATGPTSETKLIEARPSAEEIFVE